MDISTKFCKKNLSGSWLVIAVLLVLAGLSFAPITKADPAPPGDTVSPADAGASEGSSGTPTTAPASGASSSANASQGGNVTATYELAKPFGTTDLRVIIGRLGSIMTNIVGSVALLMFVYGGFVLLTSRGNADKIKQGREIFVWTTVGLFIIFGAQAVITAIINILSSGHI